MVDGVNQQPGLFQRIGNFFGADDPNAGAPTDPFAGLSRAQRTMLGFAALRDAAASLEGRDTDFFAQSLGGFEQARERERLRAQGEFANRNQALFQLAQLEFLANQPGNEGLRPLIEAQRQVLVGQVGSAVPAVSSAAGGAMPSAGVVPSTVAPAQGGNRLPRETVLDQATGQMVPYTGEPEGSQPAPAPAVAAPPAPAAVPLSPFDQEISDIDAQIEQRRADLQNALDQLSGSEAAAGMGFPVGTGGIAGRVDQIQSEINTLQDRRKTLEQRLYDEQQAAEAAATTAAQEAAAEEERSRATSARMAPLINNALSFLTDENGNIRSATSMIASQSGFAAGLMPGVSGADARLARAAIQELAAIAGMSGVAEARASGFGGSLSDADILMIQRSQGIFDLTKPEATAQTLLRLQEEMGASNNFSDEDQAIINRYSQ
jgi:uncharacterized protein (DUF2141 family)